MSTKGKREKLPAAFKRKWVAALRSGKYVQGKRALKDAAGHYCCLGVACEVAGHSLTGVASGGFIKGELMDGVPSVLCGDEFDSNTVQVLTNMNDGGRTFKQIAAYIERYL